MFDRSDVVFRKLGYEVETGVFRKSSKSILKSVSGIFKSGQLSAIIGPSGSGKTTLLNLLSGYIPPNISGVIEVNNCQSRSYIMQEENLHLILTVSESMKFSINLKTGSNIKSCAKMEKIKSILKNLGLDDKRDAFVRDLSGGQRKRLSIALELVSDPMILFLDEPTTGLDYSSSNQCIQLLKKLAQEGKTIICTIHTPSALVLKLCDQLYALADGVCIYQGSSENLVSFLEGNDLICPQTYNPCDFLMEIATGDYGSLNEKLSTKIENGLNEGYQKIDNQMIQNEKICETSKEIFSSSFFNQLSILIHRNILIFYRDITILWLRLFMFTLTPILGGIFFYQVGNEASKMFDNFKMIYSISMFLLYTNFFTMVIRFALDLPLIKREHFNRWYSTGSYYIAITLVDLPLTMFCLMIAFVIIYSLTGQPMEQFRMLALMLVFGLLTFISQGLGIFIGSMFQLRGTLFFGSTTLPLVLLFGGFLILKKDANVVFHWIFDLNFVKRAGDAGMAAILGYNRTRLNCDEAFYCHYQEPKKFLDTIGLDDKITFDCIAVLVTYLIGLRLAAFLVMNYRLKH